MGGSSYGWMMSQAGYRWMAGGTSTPGWMRGGTLVIGGPAGWAVGVVGLVPLAAGAGNVCLFAPLFHAPLRGRNGTA